MTQFTSLSYLCTLLLEDLGEIKNKIIESYNQNNSQILFDYLHYDPSIQSSILYHVNSRILFLVKSIENVLIDKSLSDQIIEELKNLLSILIKHHKAMQYNLQTLGKNTIENIPSHIVLEKLLNGKDGNISSLIEVITKIYNVINPKKSKFAALSLLNKYGFPVLRDPKWTYFLSTHFTRLQEMLSNTKDKSTLFRVLARANKIITNESFWQQFSEQIPNLLNRIEKENFEDFEKYINDILDNFPTDRIPSKYVSYSSTTDKIRELMPIYLEKEVIKMAESQELTFSVSTTRHVGFIHEGTNHGHRWIIERKGNTISIFFIDPEHFIGKIKDSKFSLKNLLRPSVTNLYAVRVYTNGSPPNICILRYRSEGIPIKYRNNINNLTPEAKNLFENNALPYFLKRLENNILFRLSITNSKSLVQSRYVTRRMIKNWLKGEENIALDWKVKSHVALMKISLKYLQEEILKAA